MTFSAASQATNQSVAVGPMGRAMAEAMDPDLLDGLQQHLNMERQAHSAYFAASIWFAERELRGFSRFFQSESANEHSHAGRVGDYLIARGQTIILQALEAPNQTWEAPVDLMATSFLLDVTSQPHFNSSTRWQSVRVTSVPQFFLIQSLNNSFNLSTNLLICLDVFALPGMRLRHF